MKKPYRFIPTLMLLSVIGAVIGLLIGLAIIGLAEAEEAMSELEIETVLVSRLVVHEANFAEPGMNDAAAIAHIVRRNAAHRGMTVQAYVTRYHRSTLDPSRTPARPWVARLGSGGARPAGWDPRLSWARHAPKWDATLRIVADVLSGRRGDPCTIRPHVWGGPAVDAERLARIVDAGHEIVDCGPTRNVFVRFRRPGEPAPTSAPVLEKPLVELEPEAQ